MGRNLLFILMLLVPVVANAAGGESPWDQKLPFEKATVTYELSGMETGSEVLYIADYGQQTATYRTTVTSMMGMKMKTETITFQDPEWIYSYDLEEGTGTKSVNPTRYMREEYQKLSKAEKKNVQKNAEKFGMSVMAGTGGEFQEKVATILGYECDMTTMMGTSVYTISGTPIPLKSETSIMGMTMNSLATSFDKGKVDKAKFSHPAGITAAHSVEGDAMSQQMAQQTIAWLKDPEATAEGAPVAGPPGMNGREQHIPAEDQEMMKQAEEMMKGIKGLFGN